MTNQQYQSLLQIMELIDGIESLVSTVPYVNGKGRKMDRLRVDIAKSVENDLELLRSTILELV